MSIIYPGDEELGEARYQHEQFKEFDRRRRISTIVECLLDISDSLEENVVVPVLKNIIKHNHDEYALNLQLIKLVNTLPPEIIYPLIEEHKDIDIKALMDDPSGLKFLDA